MSDKTEGEIYDALKGAGVKAGDLVLFDDEKIGFVTRGSPFSFEITRPGLGTNKLEQFYFRASSDATNYFFPTHFARPYWSWLYGFAFEAQILHPEGVSTRIKYETKPLTLEQRVERLEKKLEEVAK